jgi:outer membrane protein OmpA-like peptidoglycan-associated protein
LGTAYAYADVSLSFTQVSDVPFQAIDVAREGNNTGFASMAEKRAALAPPVVEIEGLVIHFVTNFSSIDAQDIGLVRDWASKHKGLVEPGALTVTGHADKTGTSNANIGLSMRRANSLARAIRDNGINIPVTNVSGHSNNEPVSQEDTAIGLAKNRRAEVGVNSPKYVIKSVREGPLHGVK